jgi:adenylylsulfate kinase-like enzyme
MRSEKILQKSRIARSHPEKGVNLTGVNDVYEQPHSPDPIDDTEKNEESATCY